MQSHTMDMIGPGSKQLASAGVLEFLRVGGFGVQIFFGVGGGITHCLPQGWGVQGGGLRRLKPDHLSMTVCSCVSITICSDERNGISSIIGNDSPLFTFILCTPNFHTPQSDCNSSLTNSSQLSFCLLSNDKLFSLAGRG